VGGRRHGEILIFDTGRSHSERGLRADFKKSLRGFLQSCLKGGMHEGAAQAWITITPIRTVGCCHCPEHPWSSPSRSPTLSNENSSTPMNKARGFGR
jgi:hypothetical protein